MQQIEAKIVITVPKDMIMIKKVEYIELQDQCEGVIGDMRWFKKQTSLFSVSTIKQRILYPFREELEDFVAYPKNGEHWKFNKVLMRRWLEKSFKKIW